MKIIKKMLCIILALVSILALNACGGNNTDADKLTILAEYLKVSKGNYKYFYAFVKNNSDDTIIDYSIAYIGFDINGNVVLDGNFNKKYCIEHFFKANILPGAVYGIADDSEDGISLGDKKALRFVKSTVSYIKFKSGKEWTINNLYSWAEDTIRNFSVAEQKSYAMSMKSAAAKAMVNPYLSFVNSKTEKKSSYSIFSGLDLHLTIKNISDKKIRSCSIISLEYDIRNKAVNRSASLSQNYEYITNNSNKIILDFPTDLQHQQEEIKYTLENKLTDECKKYLLIVESIEFEDDTVWYNDYALQFMMYNEQQKLL